MDPLFGLIPLTYFCANALDQVNISYVGQDKPVDAYSDCVAHPSMLIYGLIGSPFVIICPNFWTHVSSYPPPNNCLTVNTSIDRFRGNGESLIYYKLWMLFESIVNYYLSSRTLAVGRILEVNQCVALNAQDARYNARSYLYYFACKSPLSCFLLGLFGFSEVIC